MAEEGRPSGERLAPPARRRRWVPLVGAVVLALAVAGGVLVWENARHYQSTTDSFVAARQYAVAPKVSGYLVEVPVTDDQHVEAGDVVARIDARDYQVALEQAEAQLAHDEAVRDQALRNLGRYRFLARNDSIPQQRADDQRYLVEQSQATIAVDIGPRSRRPG